MKTASNMTHDLLREGSALLTVLIVIIVMSLCTGTIITMSLQRSSTTTRLANKARAQEIAEAGINWAYSVLATNWAARLDADAFPVTAYGDGSFDVTVTPVGSNLALIASTGLYASACAAAMCDARNYGGGGAASTSGIPSLPAYGYPILAGGNMSFQGSGTFDVGSNGVLHCNGDFSKGGSGGFSGKRVEFCGSTTLNGSWTIAADLKAGGNVTVKGSGKITRNVECDALDCSGSFKIMSNATCLTYSKTGSGGVQGTVTTGAPCTVDPLVIPDIDLTPYYSEALKNGQVYTGTKKITGSSDTAPAGGIMWVEGDLEVSGSGKLIGCFMATGYIKISGSGDQVKYGDYPALISRDSYIDISGSGQQHGLIYSKTGYFEKTGSGQLTGSIIAAGNVTAAGSWSAFTYENSCPVPPDGGVIPGSGEDLIGISAWKK